MTDTDIKKVVDEAFQEASSNAINPLSKRKAITEAHQRLLDRLPDKEIDVLLGHGRALAKCFIEDAIETWNRAADLAESRGDHQNLAEALRYVGRAFVQTRKWSEAFRALTRSAEIFADLGDDEGRSIAVLNIGIVHHEQGRYAEASGHYRTAFDLAGRAGSELVAIDAMNNLAVLATIQGFAKEAVDRYAECIRLYEARDDTAGAARSWHNAGMVHADAENHCEAIACFERALMLTEDEQASELVGNVHLSHARSLMETGRCAGAIATSGRALEVYTAVGDSLGEADVYRVLGLCFGKLEHWKTCRVLLERSEGLYNRYESPHGLAEVRRDQGHTLLWQGRTEEARDHLLKARTLFDGIGASLDARKVEALLASVDARQVAG